MQEIAGSSPRTHDNIFVACSAFCMQGSFVRAGRMLGSSLRPRARLLARCLRSRAGSLLALAFRRCRVNFFPMSRVGFLLARLRAFAQIFVCLALRSVPPTVRLACSIKTPCLQYYCLACSSLACSSSHGLASSLSFYSFHCIANRTAQWLVYSMASI